MQEIKLTKGLVAIVDDEDYDDVSQYNWTADEHENIFYASRWTQKDNVRTKIYLHRYLLPNVEKVDHKDGNGLNNRRNNLRKSSSAQNLRNTRAHKDSISKFKGVTWDKARKKWKAQIFVNGKQLYLGRFETEAYAAAVYDHYATLHFAEFAKTNKMMFGGRAY